MWPPLYQALNLIGWEIRLEICCCVCFPPAGCGESRTGTAGTREPGIRGRDRMSRSTVFLWQVKQRAVLLQDRQHPDSRCRTRSCRSLAMPLSDEFCRPDSFSFRERTGSARTWSFASTWDISAEPGRTRSLHVQGDCFCSLIGSCRVVRTGNAAVIAHNEEPKRELEAFRTDEKESNIIFLITYLMHKRCWEITDLTI